MPRKFIARVVRPLKNFLRAILRDENVLEVYKRRGFKVGRNFSMQGECIIDESHCWHIDIGDNVTFAPRVHVLAHDASIKYHLNYARIGNVKIGNNVFVGAGTIILPGVSIGDNTIIGAGTVVVKSIPDSVVAAGNPARVICTLDEYLRKEKAKMNSQNVFDESYTLRRDVGEDKRKQMKEITERFGQSFVI